jgi:cyclomaltodextrinase / maltogenic alpha-amylase / neopullulanase
MSGWAEHTIWWQLHPISFTGAEPQALPEGAAPLHRLGRIEAWLDYLIELGCNGLALGPIFASESHGYDTVDHYRIDPRLGTQEDFDHLAAACRARGIRVLLDGVFNHVGRGFPAFQDVLAKGRESACASWFRLDFDAPGPDGFGYADFEGHRSLVALNHAEPAVRDYVSGVMRYWLARGADGWRLDAAYAVPSEFWNSVIGAVRRDHQDAWFLGEVIHGDYAAAVHDGGLDSVTQYELWKAIWSSLNDRNFFELSWALERHDGFARVFRPQTFVGNHDVTRLASRLEDERHLPHALAILLTVAGIPSVYAGDEQAFHGIKYERVDGDAEIRPPFPDRPDELASFGRPYYRLHQDLIGLRRRNPWLVRSHVSVLKLEGEVLAYRAVDPGGGPGLAVLLNLSERPCAFPAEIVRGKQVLGSGVPAAWDLLEPHGWAILEPE